MEKKSILAAFRRMWSNMINYVDSKIAVSKTTWKGFTD